MAFSFRARCPVGLEPLLKSEFQQLIPSVAETLRVGNGSIDFRLPSINGDLDSNPVDKVLANLCLNSHTITGVHMQLGAPFRAEWEKQAREGLARVPWNICYRSWSAVPEVTVKSARSRLFAADHLGDLVKSAFSDFKTRSSKSSLVHDSTDHIPADLRVFVENNLMTVFVDAGGTNMCRPEPKEFESRFRLDVSPAIAAGCTLKSFTKILDRITKPCVIWDPFSGAGILALTAARTIAGVPPGSPVTPYPFRSFASHDPATFDSVSSELCLDPHPKTSLIDKYVMSESSIDAKSIAESNLARFHESLPSLEGHSVVPFPITLERKPDAYLPPKDDQVAIFTALPCGDDSQRRYAKFHEMLDSMGERLVGCVVLTSKPVEFKRMSRRRWLTDLRLFDGRRFIECLHLLPS